MNNNELREKLDEILNELNTFKAMLEEEKTQEDKSFGISIPDNLENRWCIDEIGDIYDLDDCFSVGQFVKAYLSGATFETEKQAKQYDKEKRLLFKIHKWAEEKNEGWTPDWQNMWEDKYYVEVDVQDNNLITCSTTWFSSFSKLPYFKTREIAQKCINFFGEEIIEVLVNE